MGSNQSTPPCLALVDGDLVAVEADVVAGPAVVRDAAEGDAEDGQDGHARTAPSARVTGGAWPASLAAAARVGSPAAARAWRRWAPARRRASRRRAGCRRGRPARPGGSTSAAPAARRRPSAGGRPRPGSASRSADAAAVSPVTSTTTTLMLSRPPASLASSHQRRRRPSWGSAVPVSTALIWPSSTSLNRPSEQIR